MVNTTTISPKRFRLSGNALKVIAIIAMTVDHVAWLGIETYSQAPYSAYHVLFCR